MEKAENSAEIWYTVGQVAEMTGVSAQTIRYMEQQGIIKFDRSMGRPYRIKHGELSRIMSERGLDINASPEEWPKYGLYEVAKMIGMTRLTMSNYENQKILKSIPNLVGHSMVSEKGLAEFMETAGYARPGEDTIKIILSSEKPYFSTGDLARMFGVSSQFIRDFEEKGLLEFERTPGGNRRISRKKLIAAIEMYGSIFFHKKNGGEQPMQETQSEKTFYRTFEVAEILGSPVSFVRKLIRDGKLKSHKNDVTRCHIIWKEDLDSYLKTCDITPKTYEIMDSNCKEEDTETEKSIEVKYQQDCHELSSNKVDFHTLSVLFIKARGNRKLYKFAKECGTSTATLSNVERMKRGRPCSFSIIKAVADNADAESGITLNELLSANGMGHMTANPGFHTRPGKLLYEWMADTAVSMFGDGAEIIDSPSFKIGTMVIEELDFAIRSEKLLPDNRLWGFAVINPSWGDNKRIRNENSPEAYAFRLNVLEKLGRLLPMFGCGECLCENTLAAVTFVVMGGTYFDCLKSVLSGISLPVDVHIAQYNAGSRKMVRDYAVKRTDGDMPLAKPGLEIIMPDNGRLEE